MNDQVVAVLGLDRTDLILQLVLWFHLAETINPYIVELCSGTLMDMLLEEAAMQSLPVFAK